ncbi:hypothetical protein [Amycolatopsis cihanbeyliensis]|uniref:Uncharacterized protein n=1 Tax=Amycolatopsis cihanbeyliensis TaxID=1128664 RepID=A0A542DKT2_AMYCI|nr:hypothetical protein [Amycolatopsis cihanbeyliensis]TQJ03673.1 hypothetical protein FB471_3437 [Amycolatopsis cihanbeyliensis]
MPANEASERSAKQREKEPDIAKADYFEMPGPEQPDAAPPTPPDLVPQGNPHANTVPPMYAYVPQGDPQGNPHANTPPPAYVPQGNPHANTVPPMYAAHGNNGPMALVPAYLPQGNPHANTVPPAAFPASPPVPQPAPPQPVPQPVPQNGLHGSTDGWSRNRVITHLFSYNASPGVWVWVQGTGWRRLSPASESGHSHLLLLAVTAKNNGLPVDYHEDASGQIDQLLV